MTTKPAIQSVGVVAPLVSVIVLLANRQWPGLGLTEDMVLSVFANAQQMVDLAVATVGLLMGMWGRWRAKGPIAGLVKSPPGA